MSSPGSADRLSRRGLFGLGAAAALTACSEGAPMRDAEPPADDGGRTIVVDGVALHYVRRGSDAPVVLIHGASGNLRDWTIDALPAMAARHDVIAFDRPGHGLSGWPGPEGARLSEQARLMRIALADLGVRRATLVGHSYGGSVALAWALDAPETVDGLVLLAAPSQVWPGGLGVSTDLLANPLTGPLLAATLPSVLPRSVAENAVAAVFAPQDPPPGYLREVRLDLVVTRSALRANALQLAALKDQIRVMVPRYPSLAMPVELVHGGADETVPIHIHSEPLSRQLPDARLTRLDGVGHMPHHVALPAVLAALDRIA
jgi:pimeloyl-ACP methyl ester carboxylesterase